MISLPQEGKSNEELIALFRERWDGSQKAFCAMYCVNQGNFSRFLRGKHSGPANRRAILRWLDDQIQKSASSPPLVSPAPKSVQSCTHFADLSIPYRNFRFPDICPGGVLVFVDGDHACYQVNRLQQFLDPSFLSLPSSWLHIVITSSSRHKERPPLSLKKLLIGGHETPKPPSFLSFVHSPTSTKNATDFTLAMLVERANVTIDPSVPFYLVSEDRFCAPVVANAQEFRPLSRWIGRGNDLGLSLLFASSSASRPFGETLPFNKKTVELSSFLIAKLKTHDAHPFVPYFMANDPSLHLPAHLTPTMLAESLRQGAYGGQKKEKGDQGGLCSRDPRILELLRAAELVEGLGGRLEVCKMETIAPLSPATKSFFFVTGWNGLVERDKDILVWLGLVLEGGVLYAQPKSEKLQFEKPLKRSFSDEEMRQYFRVNWRGTHRSFCDQYQVNQGVFSCWLNGKKESQASRSAILQFQKENQKK